VFRLAKKKNGTVWSIPVPLALDRAVEMAVELHTSYASKSDLVRDSVRRQLEKLGFKNALIAKEAPQKRC
jgi:Arc/MetJ-type ribon-helix-helix transcriptional regulator